MPGLVVLRDLHRVHPCTQSPEPCHPSASLLTAVAKRDLHPTCASHPFLLPPPAPAAHWCQLWGICIAQVLWFLTPDLPIATGIPYRSVTQLTERETMAFYISPGYQEPALSELCFSISLTLHCASLYQLQC